MLSSRTSGPGGRAHPVNPCEDLAFGLVEAVIGVVVTMERLERLAGGLALATLVALTGCDDPITILTDAGPGMDAGSVDAGPAMTCDNGENDGNETGIDCGGGDCPACGDGDPCVAATDCTSGVCGRGRCLVGTCSDMVRNGEETGVDCGGDCGLCPGGQPCTSNDQCISNRCRAGECTMSSCDDGTQNNAETDVDCGGGTCPACDGGFNCSNNTDCASLICAMGVCTEAACNDSVQNQDETSVDCGGGTCPPCRDGLGCQIDADCEGMRCFDMGCVSCTDRIRNAEETDVDCGGGLCNGCADGDRCVVDGDCVSNSCVANVCESCMDGVQNQDETDVDCGGTLCGGCADGQMCTIDMDCGAVGATCVGGACVSCADGVQNRTETDVDCGGGGCPACAPGLLCLGDTDCASNICDGPTGRCNAPGCGDGVLNGAETEIDCGGGSCLGCNVGQACVVGRDCLSGSCSGGLCQAPTCTDGVANGGETDVDCGGSTACPRCPDFDVCTGPTDCVTGACTMGRCGTTGCIPFPGTSTDAFGYFGCTIPATPTTLPCPDISATGTQLSLSDDSSAPAPIGFNFDFYGNVYTTANVNSNGGIGLSGSWSSIGPGTCSSVPYSSGTQDYIAVFWDDLYPPAAGSTVRYQTLGAAPNRQFVVRYDIEGYSSTPSRGVFTAVLNETTNDIDVCYQDTDFGSATYNAGVGARAGINHSSSSPGPATGLQFSCSAPNLVDGLLIRYIHP